MSEFSDEEIEQEAMELGGKDLPSWRLTSEAERQKYRAKAVESLRAKRRHAKLADEEPPTEQPIPRTAPVQTPAASRPKRGR
jgi:hypothetical protein